MARIASNAPRFTRAGRVYVQTDTDSDYLVWAQGPGYLSRQHRTGDRAEVGGLAARVARDRVDGAWLFVADASWVCTDGTCDKLTRSVYRLRNGEWQHFSGARILTLEQ